MWLQVRYVKVASQNPELVLPVMKTFLGSSGLSHPHSAHATRACYLFMRTVKVLRPQLHSHLEELIQGLIPAVMAIVANPIQTASHALKATVARGAISASETSESYTAALLGASCMQLSCVQSDSRRIHWPVGWMNEGPSGFHTSSRNVVDCMTVTCIDV